MQSISPALTSPCESQIQAARKGKHVAEWSYRTDSPCEAGDRPNYGGILHRERLCCSSTNETVSGTRMVGLWFVVTFVFIQIIFVSIFEDILKIVLDFLFILKSTCDSKPQPQRQVWRNANRKLSKHWIVGFSIKFVLALGPRRENLQSGRATNERRWRVTVCVCVCLFVCGRDWEWFSGLENDQKLKQKSETALVDRRLWRACMRRLSSGSVCFRDRKAMIRCNAGNIGGKSQIAYNGGVNNCAVLPDLWRIWRLFIFCFFFYFNQFYI